MLTKEKRAAKSSPKLKEGKHTANDGVHNQNTDRPRALCPASQIVVVVGAILVWWLRSVKPKRGV